MGLPGVVITSYTIDTIPSAASLYASGGLPGTRYILANGEILTMSLANGVPELVAGGGTAALEDFILYLAPTTGNDTNGGTTPQSPIKTLAEVKRRIPSMVAKKCRVFVTEAGSDAFPPGNFVLPSPINPNDTGDAESLVIDARAALAVTRSDIAITATSGPFPPLSTTISYGGAALPRGTLVRVSSGPGAGQYATIDSTVAGAPNVSTLVFPLANVSPGDAFESVEQGYVVDCSSGGKFVGYPGFRGIWNTVAVRFTNGFQAVSACGASPLCDFDTGGSGVFPARQWGKWLGASPSFLPADLFDPNLFGAALTIHGVDGSGNGGTLGGTTFSEIDVAPCATDTAIIFERGCALFLFPVNLVNSPLYQMQPGNLIGFGIPGIVQGRATGMQPGFVWNVESQNNEPAITGAIRIAGAGATMDQAVGSNIVSLSGFPVEDNTGYNGIEAAAGSVLSLEGITTDPAKKNSLSGLVVSGGAKVYADSSTTLSGTLNEIDLEGDAYTWATLQNAANNRPNPSALDANGNLLGKGAVSDSRGNVVGILS